MNLIRQLFSRHTQPQLVPSHSHKWAGQSGQEYQFEIYPLAATLRAMPGIYIYAKQLAYGEWWPIYISQTRDLHQRLEGHVTVQEAAAHGATHLHAHYCAAGPSARFSEEHDLVQRWQPVCNDPPPT